jgi:hydrogenase maturation protease
MTLVLGLGTDLRGDDAAGLEVARRLGPRGRTVTPGALLEAWAGAGDVVLVDAVQTGAAPGTVHRIDLVAGRVPAPPQPRSSHLVGILDMVELARALGRLPARVELVGIEGRSFDLLQPLSAEVERAVAAVVAELSAPGVRPPARRAGSPAAER